MIPLANNSAQIKFNYINKPLAQLNPSSSEIKFQSPPNPNQSLIKIEQNVRNSQQNLYKLEGYSSLQLETKKNLNSQKIIVRESVKPLQSLQSIQQTSLLQTHQSLHKAQELDPVLESTSPKVSIPLLKAQNVKSVLPKFKMEGLQEIRQSDFFKNDNQDPTNHKFNTGGQQSNLPYSANNYSNLYSRGGQAGQNGQGHPHGRKLLKQIKTFKIDKIEEKKESDFGGCCGFGIANKIAFLSKDN